MTIDEAIKLLTPGDLHETGATWSEYTKARELGIEALKRIKGQRATRGTVSRCFLPGETEEGSPTGASLSSPQQAEGYPAEEQ